MKTVLSKHTKTFSTVVLLTICSGCSTLGTYNEATQRNELIFISTREEVRMGQQIHQKISQEYTFVNDPVIANRVKKIGNKLAQVSDRQDYTHNFFVVDKNELNAFTIPGGNIYVFTGLLNRLKTDDQLASVLAHEIGHGSSKHTVKKFQAALGYDFLGKLILSHLGSQSQQILNLSSGVVMNLVFSAYGRKDEYQADKLGLKYMYLAGYDLNGMAEAFEILQEESKGNTVPVILKSHPHLKDRIQSVENEIFVLNSRYH